MGRGSPEWGCFYHIPQLSGSYLLQVNTYPKAVKYARTRGSPPVCNISPADTYVSRPILTGARLRRSTGGGFIALRTKYSVPSATDGFSVGNVWKLGGVLWYNQVLPRIHFWVICEGRPNFNPDILTVEKFGAIASAKQELRILYVTRAAVGARGCFTPVSFTILSPLTRSVVT